MGDKTSERLFDDLVRVDMERQGFNERAFSYLNRTARPLGSLSRRLLEEWFAHFPESGKKDLRARFRSPNDTQHQSAFFELYLYRLFCGMGYDLEYHPSYEGAKVHPDYLVRKGGRELCFLEATSVFPSKKEQKEFALWNQFLYDLLGKLESPDFYLDISVEEIQLDTARPTRELRMKLSEWLSSLDYEKIQKDYYNKGYSSLPIWPPEDEYSLPDGSFENLKATFRARPKPLQYRGSSDVIGVISEAGRLVNYANSIKKTIYKKAKKFGKKFGKSSLPFVVAVNIGFRSFSTLDVITALVGDQIFLPENKLDGVWLGPKGPRNRLLSAVIVAKNLTPTKLKEPPYLLHNPWASKPLSPKFWLLVQEELIKSPDGIYRTKTIKSETKPIKELLGLPVEWSLLERL